MTTARKTSVEEFVSVAEIQRKAIGSLRRYLREEENWRKTPHLRAVGERFVELREHCLTEHGEPDWRGQTWEYKQAVQEVFGLANVPPDEHESLAAAIRYHVGNILRDRLDESEITGIGLRAISPRARSSERRARQAKVAATVRDSARLDAIRLLASSLAQLKQVEPDSIRRSALREQHEATKLLDRIERELAELREKV